MNTLKLIALILFLQTLVACNSNNGGAPAATEEVTDITPTPGALNGTWFGSVEDGDGDVAAMGVLAIADGTMHTLAITISDADDTLVDESITAVELDGVDQATTGTIELVDGSIYKVTLTNADGTTIGGLVFDSTGTHAAYMDETFVFGILEKDATSLPVTTDIYDLGDIDGSWSGITTTTTDFEDYQYYDSDANCDVLNAPTCVAITTNTIVDPVVTITNDIDLTTFDFGYGQWGGTYVDPFIVLDPWVGAGITKIFMSVDKTVAAVWACDSALTFPSLCNFTMWEKQLP